MMTSSGESDRQIRGPPVQFMREDTDEAFHETTDNPLPPLTFSIRRASSMAPTPV